MQSFRRIDGNPSFRELEPDKKDRKIAKIQRLLDIFKNPSDFQTNFPRGQRLSDICRKIFRFANFDAKKFENPEISIQKLQNPEFTWENMVKSPILAPGGTI